VIGNGWLDQSSCRKKAGQPAKKRAEVGCNMSASGSTARRAARKVRKPEKRALGWQIRCLNCDFTGPWGKSGIRLKAKSRKYTFGRYPQCRRIRLRVIERVPAALF
jgi:hypothetical protein